MSVCVSHLLISIFEKKIKYKLYQVNQNKIIFQEVLDKLTEQGISVRVASPKLVMEEAPESYKNVTDVVDTCHAAGISKKTMKLRPIAVIKG